MKKLLTARGFTIIEVIIVLAIASLILLIVFLAVPTLKSSARDYKRKTYADVLHTQMGQYLVDHGGKYPQTDTEACDFLNNYATRQEEVVSVCSGGFDGIDHKTIETHTFTIGYFNNDLPHDYIGQLDEIDIALSHWCNFDPDKFHEDPSHPITNGNEWPFDSLFSRYVIWTPLERGSNIYCVDSYPRDI